MVLRRIPGQKLTTKITTMGLILYAGIKQNLINSKS